jgi:hypothetical protein
MRERFSFLCLKNSLWARNFRSPSLAFFKPLRLPEFFNFAFKILMENEFAYAKLQSITGEEIYIKKVDICITTKDADPSASQNRKGESFVCI